MRAWLSAAPGKAKVSRQAKLEAEASRTGGVRSAFLDLPEVPAAVEHMVDYLFSVGPTNGEHVLSFTEIQNWAMATGTALNEFQAQMLRELSRSFLQMAQAATDATCPAPFAPVVKDSAEQLAEKRDKISSALGAFLRSVKVQK